ncbi:MAG TPA: hypothetical protein P5069_07750 [Candidatus Hydrogenedentes bacterium]|mgnify:FL=1|nr:hypothetical protein [Candidatus Hydrogenedentota bacterium]HOC73043.1 hypothetical protein [Candidatus Hydrogenedentota bacterium]HOH51165.1 hypothetical protein [Candidatus Hydrogenedentota bacterium]HQL95562.1 hypothetical protein [Candidatus Hydrogenedentota bacterium]HRZ82344.1 hypothetical protein [Candidatus Hydrogenedentota bacterium]
MRKGIVIFGMCASAAFAMALAGCGKAAEKASEKVAEKTLEKAVSVDGGSAKVDINSQTGEVKVSGTDAEGAQFNVTSGGGDSGSFTMTQTTEGGGTVAIQSGEGTKVPADFPKDVPLYDGLAVLQAMSDTASGMFNVTGGVAAAPDAVMAFYKEKTAAQGWTETMSMNAGDMQTLMCEKDDRALSVMVSKDGEKATLSVSVSKQ